MQMDRRTGFTREEMFWVVAFGCGLGSGAAGVMGLGMEVAEMGGVVFWLAFSAFVWMFSRVLLCVEVAVGQYFRKVTTSSNLRAQHQSIRNTRTDSKEWPPLY